MQNGDLLCSESGYITPTCFRADPQKGGTGDIHKYVNKLLIFYKDGSLPWSARGHLVSPNDGGCSSSWLCWQESTWRGVVGAVVTQHRHCHAEPRAAVPGHSAPESHSRRSLAGPQPCSGQLVTALSRVHSDSHAVENLLLNVI